MADTRMTIDVTPTWGEFGNIYANMAESKEVKVIKRLRPEFAKAMAAAQAMTILEPGLNNEQRSQMQQIMQEELRKQRCV